MRPVKAARKMEACMLDAEPVNADGVEVTAGTLKAFHQISCGR